MGEGTRSFAGGWGTEGIHKSELCHVKTLSSLRKMLFHLCALALLLTITTASLLASLIEPSVSHVRRQAAPLCSQYAYHAANGYEFNNNDWGRGSATSGSQCTTVDSTSSSGVKWPTTWNWQGGQNNLKSYANVGKQFSKGLIVGNIKSMLPRIQWDYQPRDGVRANVA
ncbi:Xyloglucan-specific endo-beta-1,4-glucanase [Ascochyta rabiei]|uniref:Xyloglucan-specific endo-beta-1,4-glucanase n=1 Tax=Didymella rabiei TaxID=5454 RepID=UPI0021F96BBE|nr:Xyloglucan-specific endo-beta-1,4-glucanase [Ascochyta rabiei]UPX17625.1 Xyloglucan-specific endo-beta-1,4-glucanase [Ascochyta rabiei]